MFNDGCFQRVMYRIAFDSKRIRKRRFVAEGTEHVIEDGHI